MWQNLFNGIQSLFLLLRLCPLSELFFFPLSEIASDGLKGRVFEVSLADLQNDEVAFRKFKLITEDVQGKNCLTNFHGMDLTRDKMCSMVKKWQVMFQRCIVSTFTDKAFGTLCWFPKVLVRLTVINICLSGR